MSKPRRRVTVDTGKPVSEESEKRKPSVFERLGPGGGQRKYEERGEKSKSQSQNLYLDKCRHWLLTGDCPFGAKCKFQHGPFIAKRPSKNRGEDDISEDLRLKVKGSSDRHPSVGSESPENKSGSRSESRSRHDKETKIKSAVVVKNSTGLDSDEDESENSDNWDAEVLDYKKELELEKKRQEIQRALSQLAASEGEERENITIEKKVLSKEKQTRESVSFALKKNKPLPQQAFSSDYSGSDSSPERNKTPAKKSPKKISPLGKKKGDKKKHKQKSPVISPQSKGPRSPSPSEMGKKKEHKKKYDTEDDSPHKTKHKKMKKMEKRMDKSPDMDFPKSKKKHAPRIDKFYSEKPSKADKRLLSPDLGSPTGKRSHRSWTPTSRSRSHSRSITPTPPKKQKNIIAGGGKEKIKGEKVKQKKKKGKGKLGADGAVKDGRVSPVRIKKKKLKTELPFPIKRDIEEDLPARHSDSPGSETLPPRSPNLSSPRREKPPEREFFKGMLRDRDEDRRDLGSRKTKRKRSESPMSRDRFIPEHGVEPVYKRKGGPSQDRKFARKDTYGSEMEQSKHGDDRGRRGSPDSFRSEDRSPTPTPSSRRNHSPDIPARSRSRRDRDEDVEVGRPRDRRSPEDRRMGKESRDRRDDLDPRGPSSSGQREGYRDRYDRGEEHRQDPRERFDERFQDFPERFPERSRYPDEREQFDPRDRHHRDPNFERGRDSRQERFDSRERFAQDQPRMHQGQGREYFGDRGRAGRGRGRGFDAFQEFGSDRQSRRSEWEDRRRGEVFGQGTREWGDRHDVRRDMQRDERFDSRREDHRFDDRAFRREDERQMGRDGRPMSRGNDGRSIERGMREGWRGDMRDERMGMRDERMRDSRMDDRRRHSPSPYDKRGYRDERFPHDERMFGREDRGMDDRIRDERGLMERGRDERMRDQHGIERDMRGMDRGRDERMPMDRDRGMMERGREDRGPLDRGRDPSMDERGRGNRGREDRMGMERGREDRLRDERGSMERVEDRGFPDDRQRERGMRDDRREGREDRGFREDDDDRFSREDRNFRSREFREERGGREERRRDDGRDRLSRAKSTPENYRTPDRGEKEDSERMSRDGSPKEERPQTSSSRSERSKDKLTRDDKSSEKSSKDSRTSREERGVRDDRMKDEKIEKRKKEDRSPKRDKEDRSPKREGRKEERDKWPPKADQSDVESVEGGKQEDGQSKDARKRSYEKEEIPLSPIPKRLRDVSPASSCRSKGSHSSRYRVKEKDASRPRRRGDSGSDKDEQGKKKGSLEREKKIKRKDDKKVGEKKRSVSPRPTKDSRADEKVDKSKSKGRGRSRSVSSSRSKDTQKEVKEEPAEFQKKGEGNLYDEDNISAIVSLGGKSSLADDEKGSDNQSIRSVQFSDWSEDDMADNILNQAEAEADKLDRLKRSPSRTSLGSKGSALDRKLADQGAAGKERYKEEVRDAGGDNQADNGQATDKNGGQLDDELDAHPEYEEISSDEDEFMEEETEKQQSIVNILDIDWSSLKEPTKPKAKRSALQRFTPASIFSQIGVSRAYAGDALFEKIKSVCQKQLDAQAEEENGETENDENKPKKEVEKFVLHDTVAAFHCSALRKIRERADLLRNIGPHRRALCARKDLEIRRKLCKVNKVFDQSPVYPGHVMDTDLSKLSIQLFRQGRDITPDKKDIETDMKTEITPTA